jgi:hypothetical protein
MSVVTETNFRNQEEDMYSGETEEFSFSMAKSINSPIPRSKIQGPGNKINTT